MNWNIFPDEWAAVRGRQTPFPARLKSNDAPEKIREWTGQIQKSVEPGSGLFYIGARYEPCVKAISSNIPTSPVPKA